jgi:hypothetical protein
MAKKYEEPKIEEIEPTEKEMYSVKDILSTLESTESVFDRLRCVQRDLKAPKNQYNSFGKYRYRSCEDILEGVKPILQEYGCAIVLSDTIEQIGDRFYVKATATFYDCDTGESVSNTAYARESDDKKGMDASQITGTASSYARKYALNGLLLIDDTKDADTDENRNETTGRARSEAAKKGMATKEQNALESANQIISEKDVLVLKEMMQKKGIDPNQKWKGKELSELTNAEWVQAVNWLEKK